MANPNQSSNANVPDRPASHSAWVLEFSSLRDGYNEADLIVHPIHDVRPRCCLSTMPTSYEYSRDSSGRSSAPGLTMLSINQIAQADVPDYLAPMDWRSLAVEQSPESVKNHNRNQP